MGNIFIIQVIKFIDTLAIEVQDVRGQHSWTVQKRGSAAGHVGYEDKVDDNDYQHQGVEEVRPSPGQPHAAVQPGDTFSHASFCLASCVHVWGFKPDETRGTEIDQ